MLRINVACLFTGNFVWISCVLEWTGYDKVLEYIKGKMIIFSLGKKRGFFFVCSKKGFVLFIGGGHSNYSFLGKNRHI